MDADKDKDKKPYVRPKLADILKKAVVAQTPKNETMTTQPSKVEIPIENLLIFKFLGIQ